MAKTPAKTKRATKKAGHLKVSSKEMKRMPKLRLPRNMAGKPHVKMVFDLINSGLINGKMRADIVEAIAKFAMIKA